MIYRNTSIAPIIMKLAREFKDFSSDMIGDVVEMVGECLEDIGYIGQTESKESIPVIIDSHRGEIPCDLIKLNGEPVYNGKPLPYGTGNFRYTDTEIKDISGNTINEFTENSDFHIDLTKTKGEIAEQIITELTYKNASANNYSGTESYKIIPNYFKTTFEEGIIYIDYEAWVRDENGFPMIPDNIQFRDAVTKYLIMKFIYIGYNHPVVSYKDAAFEYKDARLRARIFSDTWDRPKMNSFMNQWVRLVPNINPQNQFYETLRNIERIR